MSLPNTGNSARIRRLPAAAGFVRIVAVAEWYTLQQWRPSRLQTSARALDKRNLRRS